MAGASGVIGIPAQQWAQYMLVFNTTIETMTNDHVHEKFIRPIKDWYEWLKNMRTAARDYNSLIGSFKSWYKNKGQQHVANVTGNISSWYNKRKDEAKYLLNKAQAVLDWTLDEERANTLQNLIDTLNEYTIGSAVAFGKSPGSEAIALLNQTLVDSMIVIQS